MTIKNVFHLQPLHTDTLDTFSLLLAISFFFLHLFLDYLFPLSALSSVFFFLYLIQLHTFLTLTRFLTFCTFLIYPSFLFLLSTLFLLCSSIVHSPAC